jgi:hypothetical protein
MTASQDSSAERVRSDMKLVHESRIHMQSPTSPSRSAGGASTVEATLLGAAEARESAVKAAECRAKCSATYERNKQARQQRLSRMPRQRARQRATVASTRGLALLAALSAAAAARA